MKETGVTTGSAEKKSAYQHIPKERGGGRNSHRKGRPSTSLRTDRVEKVR